MRFCFLSNLSMVFPMIVAYRHGMGFTTGLLLFTMIASMVYHLDEANDYGLLMDIFAVTTMVSVGFYTAMHSTFLLTPMNIISSVLWVAALYCYIAAGPDTCTSEYNDYHAAWHVLAAYSIAAYIYSHGHTQNLASNPSRLAKAILVRDEGDYFEREFTLLSREVGAMARSLVTYLSRGRGSSPPPQVAPRALGFGASKVVIYASA